jgi:hypothetical protein
MIPEQSKLRLGNQTSILSCLQEESGESTNTSDEAANVESRSSAGELRGRAGLCVTTSLGRRASASRDRRHNTSAGGNNWVRSASWVGSHGDGCAVDGSLDGLGGRLLGLGSLCGHDDSGSVSRDAQNCRRRDNIGAVLVNNSSRGWARNCRLLNNLGGGDLSDC